VIGEYVRIDECLCYDRHTGQLGQLVKIDDRGYHVHLSTWHRTPCISKLVTIVSHEVPNEYKAATKTKASKAKGG
jgi:hypothetical protein